MRYVIALLMVILTGCCSAILSPVAVKNESPAVPPVVLHADTDFTEEERGIINDASIIWKAQTSGAASIVVVYDLDFESLSNLADHVAARHHIIRRMEVGMDEVGIMDTTSKGTVLGWVDPIGGVTVRKETVNMALVPGRFGAERSWAVQIVLHEFGHALGLRHTYDKSDIMYPSVQYGRKPCLRKNDLKNYCAVADCGARIMKPCE